MDPLGSNSDILVDTAVGHGTAIFMEGSRRWLEPEARLLVHLAFDQPHTMASPTVPPHRKCTAREVQ